MVNALEVTMRPVFGARANALMARSPGAADCDLRSVAGYLQLARRTGASVPGDAGTAKIGDVPKSPFPSVAALVPSAGTITTPNRAAIRAGAERVSAAFVPLRHQY